MGKGREGGIRTCQTHLVLKDKSRRKYLGFEKVQIIPLARMKFEFEVIARDEA